MRRTLPNNKPSSIRKFLKLNDFTRPPPSIDASRKLMTASKAMDTNKFKQTWISNRTQPNEPNSSLPSTSKTIDAPTPSVVTKQLPVVPASKLPRNPPPSRWNSVGTKWREHSGDTRPFKQSLANSTPEVPKVDTRTWKEPTFPVSLASTKAPPAPEAPLPVSPWAIQAPSAAPSVPQPPVAAPQAPLSTTPPPVVPDTSTPAQLSAPSPAVTPSSTVMSRGLPDPVDAAAQAAQGLGQGITDDSAIHNNLMADEDYNRIMSGQQGHYLGMQADQQNKLLERNAQTSRQQAMVKNLNTVAGPAGTLLGTLVNYLTPSVNTPIQFVKGNTGNNVDPTTLISSTFNSNDNTT